MSNGSNPKKDKEARRVRHSVSVGRVSSVVPVEKCKQCGEEDRVSGSSRGEKCKEVFKTTQRSMERLKREAEQQVIK